MNRDVSRRGILLTVLPIIAGALATAILDQTGLDLGITQMFFHPNGPNGGWVHADNPVVWFLYAFGEYIGAALAGGIALLFLLSARNKIDLKYSSTLLLIVLTVAIGPGLIVNGIFKNYWGRPRPVEIKQFGGQWDYRKVWEPGIPGQGKSFPCGHCSMGYAFVSTVALYRFHPVGAVISGGAAILYGTALGIGRIAQGGHFASDVIWAAMLVFATISALYYFVLKIPSGYLEVWPIRPSLRNCLIFQAIIAIVILLNTPFYQESIKRIDIPKGIDSVIIQPLPYVISEGPLIINDPSNLIIRTIKAGLGLPGGRLDDEFQTVVKGDQMFVRYGLKESGHIRRSFSSIRAESF